IRDYEERPSCRDEAYRPLRRRFARPRRLGRHHRVQSIPTASGRVSRLLPGTALPLLLQPGEERTAVEAVSSFGFSKGSETEAERQPLVISVKAGPGWRGRAGLGPLRRGLRVEPSLDQRLLSLFEILLAFRALADGALQQE